MNSLRRRGVASIFLIPATALALTLGLLAGTAPAAAQLQTGNLYGTVADQKGSVLPGVTMTLSGEGAPLIQVTGAAGEFRFLSLSPATYVLKAELAGYSPVERPNIVINVGRNTILKVTLNSAIEEQITVTGETPLLDEKAIRTGNTVSQAELQRIPTARDPWAVLQSTPGVLLDRVNVGGNESGQQAEYVGPGSTGDQSVWAVDGVVITDMAATGGSPAYYDFDSFEEMQITTGGSDSTIATGGVVVNLVTKRGTNEYRGSARFYDVSKSTQSASSFNNSDLPAGQPPIATTNQINKVQDYGAEIGGPILKDHLWAWGSYARQQVNLVAEGGVTDNTTLPAWNAKINAQLTAGNSLTLFGFDSDKVKHGRDAGPTRPQETTWDQQVFGGKPTLLKAEDTQIFGSNFYLTVLYSHVYGGFSLIPESGIGPGTPAPFEDANGVFHNSFSFSTTERPQTQEKADASTFFTTGNLSHELKYGAAYRQALAISNAGNPGGGFLEAPDEDGFGPPPNGLNGLYLSRNALSGIKTRYTSGYVQDTVTTGRLTANLGLRYDVQGGDNLPESVPANPIAPDLLPAVNYAGGNIGFEWKTFSPRLGLTYALGKDHDTLLHASYSRFADQLSQDGAHASILNPLGGLSYYFAATTNPGDGHLTPSQVVPIGLGWSGNVNPNNPSLLVQPNAVSPHLSAPLTDEFLVSAEHALLPELVVGLDLTYRVQKNLLQQDQLVYDDPNPADPATFLSVGRVATRADYQPVTVQVMTPTGLQNVTYYQLNPNLSTHDGVFLHNSSDEITYKGASLTWNKRLSNRWMTRGNFTWSDWYYSKVTDRPDPTIMLAGGSDGLFVTPGEVVVQNSGTASGNKAEVFINSKWSFAWNALYQIAPDRPWGFDVAGNFTGRQGYPTPWFVEVLPDGNALPDIVQVGTADAHRVDNIFDFDARIAKEVTFQDFGVTFSVDCFNLFNESYVLQRKNQLFATDNPGPLNVGFIDELLSPRIFRFGVRFSFR
jgi:hypothetical protein